MKTTQSAIKLTLIGLGIVLVSVVMFNSLTSFAAGGAYALVGQDSFTISGPNAPAKLTSAMNNAGDIIPGLEDKENDSNIRFSKGPKWADASFDCGINFVPGFDTIHMAIKLTATENAPVCSGGQPGWKIELDLRGSSANISDNYDGIEIRLCGITPQADGSLALNAKAYLISGPKQNPLTAFATGLQMKAYIPKVEKAMSGLFNNAR